MQVLDVLIATMLALLLAPVVGVAVSQALVAAGVFSPEAQGVVFVFTGVLLWAGLIGQRLLRARSVRLARAGGDSPRAAGAGGEWVVRHRSR